MKISALKVQQWLKEWDGIPFDAKKLRAKPEPYFYLFSLSARDLRALCGIYPRSAKGRKKGSEDLGIQRRHDSERSEEISQFIRYGHPWAGLSQTKQKSGKYDDLKKPGWLPTAIVVNILKQGSKREGKGIAANDIISVKDQSSLTNIELPNSYSGPRWRSSSIPPIEVIDGQHRLWAFGDDELDGEFQLPVVAFHGLDISWQAYLFYTINIKPKRINSSLAFDLYPLLRTEDWIERFDGAIVYRETRAQELVDLLYSHPDSPWFERINMLGEKGPEFKDVVTQAAWVRSLLATFVKSWEGKRIGGLFGAQVGNDKQVLPWSRQEQAAFLISFGIQFKNAVGKSQEKWAKSLRETKSVQAATKGDLALWGRYSLISQDQGIRGLLNVANDLCYLNADTLKLREWQTSDNIGGSDLEVVSQALKTLNKTPAHRFLGEIAQELTYFDWRASSAPDLTPQESLMKGAFRGSGGYKDLRRELLLHLKNTKGKVSEMASLALEALGY